MKPVQNGRSGAAPGPETPPRIGLILWHPNSKVAFADIEYSGAELASILASARALGKTLPDFIKWAIRGSTSVREFSTNYLPLFEPELERAVADFAPSDRRDLAAKLEYWAGQLNLSAGIIEGSVKLGRACTPAPPPPFCSVN